MNTTKLIGQWSMEGAARDADGRVRSVQEVLRLFAPRTVALTEPRARTPLQAKAAGEATREALHGNVGGGGGGRF